MTRVLSYRNKISYRGARAIDNTLFESVHSTNIHIQDTIQEGVQSPFNLRFDKPRHELTIISLSSTRVASVPTALRGFRRPRSARCIPRAARAVPLKIEKLEKNQAQSRRKPFPEDSRYNGIWTNPIELQVVAYTRLKRAQQTRLASSYEEFQFPPLYSRLLLAPVCRLRERR